MEEMMIVRPYDYDVADDVFRILFMITEHTREDGLEELPAASYQLVVSALEAVRWELHGEERENMSKAIATVERLRDEQKKREWKRERSET